MYSSQLGQDKFIDEFFEKKEGLTFVDIGAHDGISISNTYFLETERNWNGICIEAQPLEFEKLKTNRNCIALNVAVSDYNGETDFTCIQGYANMLSGISDKYNPSHLNRIQNEVRSHGGSIETIKVQVKTLQSILEENSLLNVDFCSIDTEGSELEIVKSIDFEKTNIKVFIIENNYNDVEIKKFLESKNYILFKKIEWDDVYVKQ